MKTKRFSIGVIFLVLMICTSCTKEELLLTPYGDSHGVKYALIPVSEIKFEDNHFEASVFYNGITGVDGIAVINNNKLLAVQEWSRQENQYGVYELKKGNCYDIKDAFSTLGPPFNGPDDILLYSDRTVYVADGQAQTVFKIPKGGGMPTPFVTTQSTNSSTFNPFGLAVAPEGFNGPNVNPGDIIVTDNAYGTVARALWAINPTTGKASVLASGSELVAGPILADFSSDGTLFVQLNVGSGYGRIINVSSEGEISTFYKPTHGNVGASLAIHPMTDIVYFQKEEGEIYKLPKTGGTPTLFASNIGHFQDITFNKDGTMMFLGYRDYDQVIRIYAKKVVWEKQ